jgi:hypothetical protein
VRYKTANTLKPTEAAYIAGLVDGEGSITLTRKHKGDNRQAALSIASTERCLLEYVLDRAGVGKITNKTTKSGYKPAFTYSVYNRQALDLIEQIQPYLISYKKQRADLLLSDYLRLTPRNGKYTEELKVERLRFESSFLAIK